VTAQPQFFEATVEFANWTRANE